MVHARASRRRRAIGRSLPGDLLNHESAVRLRGLRRFLLLANAAPQRRPRATRSTQKEAQKGRADHGTRGNDLGLLLPT